MRKVNINQCRKYSWIKKRTPFELGKLNLTIKNLLNQVKPQTQNRKVIGRENLIIICCILLDQTVDFAIIGNILVLYCPLSSICAIQVPASCLPSVNTYYDV